MTRQRIIIWLICLTLPFQLRAQDAQQELNNQLWEAARKGDAVTVKALLNQGADVNAKFRYGATALSYAADKGHVEVINILLERGAEVNVRDTFYHSTPLEWATSKGHVSIIKALLDKGAEGVDDVLKDGARQGKAEIVRLALAKGGVKPETLSAALAASMGDPQKVEITEMLRKAGAIPPPEVAMETLKSYAGKYKSEQGLEIIVTLKEGKLQAARVGQDPFTWSAVNQTTFTPVDFDGLTIIFNVEGGQVLGFTFKQGPNTTILKKVE